MGLSQLLTQTATLWSPLTMSVTGDRLYTRTTIKCRWQRHREDMRDMNGQEFTSAAIVYTTTNADEGSFMFEGSSGLARPEEQKKAYQVRIIERSQSPIGNIELWKITIG